MFYTCASTQPSWPIALRKYTGHAYTSTSICPRIHLLFRKAKHMQLGCLHINQRVTPATWNSTEAVKPFKKLSTHLGSATGTKTPASWFKSAKVHLHEQQQHILLKKGILRNKSPSYTADCKSDLPILRNSGPKESFGRHNKNPSPLGTLMKVFPRLKRRNTCKAANLWFETSDVSSKLSH